MKLRLGYKASAEQFGPQELLDLAVLAEEKGFDSVWVSDHYQPFRHTDGHAPFSLSWLPAAAPPTRPNEIVRGLLRDALEEARGDVDRFRAVLERSFDDVMDRASGWYKRRIQLILFLLALTLVGVMNADSFAVGQRLWKDDALRAAVVAQANKVVQAGGADCAKTDANEPRTAAAAKCVSEVSQYGLPLGWTHATSPHSLGDGFGKVLGLLVTAFALTLGAPFYFDLLGKVARVRGSGPPPASGADSKPAKA